MKRPVFICFVLLAIGILSVSLVDNLLITGGIFAAMILISFKIRMMYKSKAAWLFLAFPVMGMLLAYTASIPVNMEIDEIAGRGGPVTIEGLVHDATLTSTGIQRLTIFTQAVTSGGEVYYERLKIRATQRADREELTMAPGSRVILTGTLHRLQPARNPGGFNELHHLGARGYDYTMRIAYWREIGAGATTLSVLRGFRDNITAIYYQWLPYDKAGILAAMVTGDRSGLTDYVRDLYRNSGIYHVLVISGMHISIMGLFADRILRQFLSVKAAAFITLGFLCLYCIFTGASTSTVRAVLMIAIVLLSKLFQKEPDLASSASLAGIIMLLYEPRWIFDIGFQYSFSAVLGLGFFVNPVSFNIKQKTGIEKGPLLWVMELFAASLIVFVTTIPVQIYHFNYIITYSIFVNMIVLPLLSFIIVPGFIMGLLGLIFAPAAGLLSGVIYFLLAFYENVSLFAADLPFSRILTASPHYLFAMGFMAVLAGLWYLFASEFNLRLKLKFSGTVLTIFALAFGIYSFWPKDPIIIKLDVGQGDTVVIERAGEVFIIDAGGWHSGDQPIREVGQNTGARIIIPYLERRGISRIDGIFVSHLHLDHAFGAVELLEFMDVGRLYLPFLVDRGYPTYQMLIDASMENGVEIMYLRAGDLFESAGGISFLVLSPSENINYENTNEASLVLYVNMEQSIIFTGDIGFPTEARLINRFSHLHSDILKIAHHGSRFSTGDEFLDAVMPRVAIAGVGVHNVFGHPHPTVTSRLYERGIPFYSTHTHGAITINLRNNRVTTMLGGLR